MSSKGKPSSDESGSTSTTSVPAKLADQQSQLEFELDFFAGILHRNPDYVDALRVHGNNLTLKGRYEDGLKIDRRLVRLRPCDPLAHYNLACSYALLKKVDSSLRALRKAMEFIFAVHVPIAGLALLPLVSGLPIIFGPIHIAFLEMVIDPVCTLVFEA